MAGRNCTCLHHSCARPAGHYGLCPPCEEQRCEHPEEVREAVVPAPWPQPGDGPRWPPAQRCSICGGVWHEATGHLDERLTNKALRVRRFCWRCTLELIATIKTYDWSQVPKGHRRSAWLLLNGRPVIKPQKVTAKL